MGLPISEAIENYSLLTIGDGLVSQIPALLVSISAGLIVTRSAGGSDLGTDVFAQFRRQRSAIRVGRHRGADDGPDPRHSQRFRSSCWASPCSWWPTACPTTKRSRSTGTGPGTRSRRRAVTAADGCGLARRAAGAEHRLDLIGLVDGASGGDLLDRVSALRRKLASELGFVMPSIRTRDAGDLPSSTYVIRVHGVEVGQGRRPAARCSSSVIISKASPARPLASRCSVLAARWVPVEYQAQAEMSGNTVVDRSTLVVTHLAEIVRRRAGRLLSRSDVKVLIDGVKATDPQVVDDLNTVGVTADDAASARRPAGRRRADPRPGAHPRGGRRSSAHHPRTIESMVEAARNDLGPAITTALASDGRLTAVTCRPHRAPTARRSAHADGGSLLELVPDDADRSSGHVGRRPGGAPTATRRCSCARHLRPALGRLVKATVPGVAVVNYGEIGDHLQIDVIANVDLTAFPNQRSTTMRTQSNLIPRPGRRELPGGLARRSGRGCRRVARPASQVSPQTGSVAAGSVASSPPSSASRSASRSTTRRSSRRSSAWSRPPTTTAPGGWSN